MMVIPVADFGDRRYVRRRWRAPDCRLLRPPQGIRLSFNGLQKAVLDDMLPSAGVIDMCRGLTGAGGIPGRPPSRRSPRLRR